MSNLPDYLLGGRIIAKPINQKEEVLPSGFIIPETANADIESALVIKADKDIHAYVKAGDTILFAKGTGQGQIINGEPHLWIDVNQIWGGFSSPLSVVKDDE